MIYDLKFDSKIETEIAFDSKIETEIAFDSEIVLYTSDASVLYDQVTFDQEVFG